MQTLESSPSQRNAAAEESVRLARVVCEIPYAFDRDERNTGDLYLPNRPSALPPVLLIHGGGWNAGSKNDFVMPLPYFLEAGRAVFSINYRLIDMAPWPACGDDCLEAARFVLSGGLARAGLPAPESLMVCGASAGGHLAMMTGIRLPRKRVEAIVSLAGGARFDWVVDLPSPNDVHRGLDVKFFGKAVALDSPEMISASPALIVEEAPPPLFCLHSTNDRLIVTEHSYEAAAAWRARNGRSEVITYPGPGENHGFCVNDDRVAGVPMPEVSAFLRRMAQSPF